MLELKSINVDERDPGLNELNSYRAQTVPMLQPEMIMAMDKTG